MHAIPFLIRHMIELHKGKNKNYKVNSRQIHAYVYFVVFDATILNTTYI